MPALVYTDYSMEAKKHNEKIRIPLPQDFGKPRNMDTKNGSVSTDIKDPVVELTLDQWKYTQFQMDDKELKESLSRGIIPSRMESAIKSLANGVDVDLLKLYRDVPFFCGSAGITPQAAADLIAARKILQDNLCPPDSRRLVLDTAAEASFLDLFKDADKTGTTAALREASLGRLFQFETYSDQLMPYHECGTFIGTNPVAGAVSAGGNRITISGGSGAETIRAGDLFTVAGVHRQFVVCKGDDPDKTDDENSVFTASGGRIENLKFYPPTPIPIQANAAVTLQGSHVPNLGFRRDAFALAVRPLADDEIPSESSTISTQTDPLSGISLRLETWRTSEKATRYWRFDILYGVKTIRPELAVRMLG
jgi:hypothetical protein